MVILGVFEYATLRNLWKSSKFLEADTFSLELVVPLLPVGAPEAVPEDDRTSIVLSLFSFLLFFLSSSVDVGTLSFSRFSWDTHGKGFLVEGAAEGKGRGRGEGDEEEYVRDR
jgi:hypothetical protein